ncbi:hypothetical protein BGX28_006261 [Mortierella sp. GBA30]|nr:hypothetical protein BGX28_006261 [Mortierella sp. GBA30]
MTPTLYRFKSAEGLIHLLDDSTNSNNSSLVHLKVDSIHESLVTNGQANTPSPIATKEVLSFDNLVCDFDETITDHDTTSSFDKLASQFRTDEHDQPEMTWSEILQAYLDDLEKVDVSDLCHLNRPKNGDQQENHQVHHPQPSNVHQHHHHIHHHHLMDPKVRDLKCHIDGRTFTPEPELPVPKIPSLQPWIYSQVRKRAVEKVSLDRVYESGNLVGLTKPQIREYGREQVRLRPGVVKFLKAFVKEQDRKEAANERRGELWILSVNWSKDLIRGAMDQVFGSEEATQKYLPDSNLISSNLQFSDACHEELMRRRKSSATASSEEQGKDKDRNKDGSHQGPLRASIKRAPSDPSVHLSNGKVKVHCLTGTDKLHAFRKIQKDYVAKHDLAPTEVKWAYVGDSSTDLGCLVEADVGIIVGQSKSLLADCERTSVQVVDLVEQA